MRGVQFFMFLVLIPALAALGHDIYLFYTHEGFGSVASDMTQMIEDKGSYSMFASLGYIWTQYSEESFRAFAQSMDEETWAYVNTLLTYKAFFIGLAFAAFFYVILGVLKLLGTWPFTDSPSSTGRESFSYRTRTDEVLGQKTKKVKYKRK